MDNKNDPYYIALPEKEKWTIKLLSRYVDRKLRVLSGERPSYKAYINVQEILPDQRRAPTIRKHLESLGLILPYGGNSFQVIEPAVEALLSKYEAPSEFNVTGYVTSYYPSSKIADNLVSCYISIGDLFYRGLIYVYRHQDEYDIQLVKGSSCNYTKIFPVALFDTLKKNILRLHAEHYTKCNIFDVLKGIYGWESRIDIDDGNLKVAYFEGFEGKEITEETLTTRIATAAKEIRHLRRACMELLRLRKTLRELPNHEADLYTAAQQFIYEQSPLWINMTEKELLSSSNRNRNAMANMYLKGEPPMYPS